MTEFEKEALLFYYGLKEIVPQPAASVVEEIVNQKRDNILALQNLIKELKADVDDFLVVAMHSELMAKRFYEGASGKAKSQAGKKFFRDLADFEQSHFCKIKKIIESRNKGLKFESFEPKPPISVEAEVEGEFEPNKDEIVDVLILGINAEKSAQERYKKIAELMDDPEGKKIFEDIAQEEKAPPGIPGEVGVWLARPQEPSEKKERRRSEGESSLIPLLAFQLRPQPLRPVPAGTACEAHGRRRCLPGGNQRNARRPLPRILLSTEEETGRPSRQVSADPSRYFSEGTPEA